jgi:hypothetical protein
MTRDARLGNSGTGQTGRIERPRSMLVRLTGELAERYLRRFAGPAAGPLEDPGLVRFDLVLLPTRGVSVLWALLQAQRNPDATGRLGCARGGGRAGGRLHGGRA